MITLADLLSRMDGQHQTISNVEEELKVNHIDDAIRNVTRVHNLPWNIKKTTLRVFEDVFTYPVPSDFKELALLDKSTGRFTRSDVARPDFMFTSLAEALADFNWRNKLAEVWNNGVLTLGMRYRGGLGSALLKSYYTDTSTLSGDATSATLDDVFLGDEPSLRVLVTENLDTFTVEETFTNHTDATYRRKYPFRGIYLDSAPTSIVLKVGLNSTNYYSATVTTQFDGTPLVGGQLNVVAFDLNTATVTGSPSNSFVYQSVTVNGVSSGYYYLSASYLREWTLLDLYYYSRNNVVLIDNTEREFFIDTSATPKYATDAQLKGEDLWSDVILYEAMNSIVNEQENKAVAPIIERKSRRAWAKLFKRYPDMSPLVTTTYYQHTTDFMEEGGPYGGYAGSSWSS